MRSRTILCVAMSIGLAACGSSTAPGGISVGGHWHITVTNLSGGGHVCSGGFDVNFVQSLGTFNGQYANNTITCTTSGGDVSIGPGAGSVADGKVDGQTIDFQLDNSSHAFSGTVNVTQMSGGVTWTQDFHDGNPPVSLAGAWTAQKQ